MKKIICAILFCTICFNIITGNRIYATSNQLVSIENAYRRTFKDVTKYGVKNNGSDTTTKLNALPSGNYYFPKGVYGIDGDNFQGFIPKSNSIYIFEEGAVLKILQNNYSNYAAILIKDCDGVTLINPTIQGDRKTHDFSSGGTHEWGHGILIYKNCGKVTIKSPHIYDVTGDGIDIISPGSNITIDDLKIQRARRQGISIEDAGIVMIDGGMIEDIDGTWPESGIAIEPYLVGQNLNDITINNITTKNTRQGLLFANLHMANNYKITINNCIVDGIFVCNTKRTSKGVVNINNPIINGKNVGIFWTNAFVKMNLKNPIFMVDDLSNEGTNEGVFRFCESNKEKGDSIGGLTCTNAQIWNDQSESKYATIFNFYNSKKSIISDINISVTKSNMTNIIWAKMPSTLKNIKLSAPTNIKASIGNGYNPSIVLNY